MKPIHDRLDLLNTFLRIAETGSLSKAANALGITQPTASRRLLELERLLGCKLALRTTASFSLTDEGRSLVVQARVLSDGWASLSERISGRRARPEGTLRVIGPPGYGTSLLTDVLTDLRIAWPQLRVEMTLTNRVIDLVATGAECWVCVGEVHDPGLICRPLGEMERILVASPELLKRTGPVTLAKLPSLPCVGLNPYFVDTARLSDRHGNSQTVSIDTPLRTDSLLSSYRAILNGNGIGAAAPWMCQGDLDAGQLKRVLPNLWLDPVRIQVALPPGLHRPARVTAFIEALCHRLNDMPGFKPWTPDLRCGTT